MELLEYLTKCTGCDFLSDLKLKTSHSAIKRALETVNVVDYSMHEWTDAADYLLGCERSFQSADDAREFILRSL